MDFRTWYNALSKPTWTPPPGTITPRAMGRIRRRWANPEVAKRALRALEQAGHGKLVEEPAEGGRGRPTLYFEPHPAPEHPAVDNNAETPGISIFVNGNGSDKAACAVVQNVASEET